VRAGAGTVVVRESSVDDVVDLCRCHRSSDDPSFSVYKRLFLSPPQ